MGLGERVGAADAIGVPGEVVTFLFTDIEGSTSLWDTRPADMLDAMAGHDRLVGEAVLGGGGTVLQSKGEGDSILAVFADPAGAVGAAVDIQRRLARTAFGAGLTLRVRIGLVTGEVMVRDGIYVGPLLNRGARIRTLARGGETLVAESTAAAVRSQLAPDLSLLDLGRHELRGFARPERVFAVIGPGLGRPSLDPLPASLRVEQPPLPTALASADTALMVGREPQLDVLLESWRAAVGGQLGAVLVGGEPGIGKTRLAAAMAGAAHRHGGVVLYGRCDDDLGVPYQPVVQAIGQLLEGARGDDLGGLLAGFGRHLTRLLPQLADAGPDWAFPPGAEPEVGRFALFDAVRRLFAYVASARPVLLVLDDLHWATESTLLLLRHLLRAEPMALMVVATFRDTGIDRGPALTQLLADLRRDTGVVRVSLGGLDVGDVDLLLRAGTGADEGVRSADVARLVHAESAGNPFFVRELVAHLADGDVLAGLAADESQAVVLPDSIREVVTHRVGRLSPPAQRLLTVAAAVGLTFELRLLRQLPDLVDGASLMDAVDEGVRAGLLSELGESDYAFAHALVRDVLYASMSRTRRAVLHQSIGAAIAALPETTERVAAVARHYSECVALVGSEEAARWLLRAGEQSLNQLAFDQAAAFAGRGLAVLDSEASVHDRLRAELLLTLADARLAQGDVAGFKEATADAADAARRAQSVDLFARAAILRSRLGTQGVPEPDTAALCEEALAAVGEHDPVVRAELLSALGFCRVVFEGDGLAAAELAREAVDLAREAGAETVLARALYVRSIGLAGYATWEERLANVSDLLALTTKTNDMHNHGWGLLVAVPLRLEVADVDGFEELLSRLEHLAGNFKDWYLMAVAVQYRGCLALAQGRFGDAEVLIREVLATSRHTDFLNVYAGQTFTLARERGALEGLVDGLRHGVKVYAHVAAARAVLLLALLDLGRMEEVGEIYAHFRDRDFDNVPRDSTWAYVTGALVEACAALGDVASASHLRASLEHLSGTIMLMAYGAAPAGAADRYLAMLTALEGDRDAAAVLFDRASELEARAGFTPLVARTMRCRSRALGSASAD